MDNIRCIHGIEAAPRYLRFYSNDQDNLMATATGFFYEFEEELFLITNAHNITRANPEQNKRISKYAANPVNIKARTSYPKNEPAKELTEKDFFNINLYHDEDCTRSKWFIHPKYGYLVDIVAIPYLKKNQVPSGIKIFPLNNHAFNEFQPFVSDDVFILGYPLDINCGDELPIWKRGTVASQPSAGINELPKFLVDTATRPGMSGAPVMVKTIDFNEPYFEDTNGTKTSNVSLSFIGVYSGRVGTEKEFMAQLGVVWRKELIEEILKAKKKGSIDFQKL